MCAVQKSVKNKASNGVEILKNKEARERGDYTRGG